MRCIENKPGEEFVPSSIGDSESSICERFERIVRQYRERIAVKMGDRALTYDALNRAANRIAHAIVQAQGTQSEPMALFLEHGIDSIIAILAVLKAGKFYVALDDSFPAERIQYMLTDSQARLVLTHTRQLKFVGGLAGARGILNIDEVTAVLSDDNLALPISPRDFATRCVVRRYRPPCYAGRIVIIASKKVYQKDPTLGWSGIARDNLRTHSVPGDHDSYLREHVHVTAQQLRKCLERAKGRAADKSALESVQAHA